MASSSGAAAAAVTKDNIADLTFYQIFHLDVSSGQEAAATVIATADVQKLYRRYALLFHPDKDPSDEARAAFERVKLALDTFIDPIKKSEYDQVLFADPDGTTASASAQAQRRKAAEAEADWAEQILKQKEARELAAKTAVRRAAEAKEQTAQSILYELTHALQTPFRQMEADMVRDWDVTPDTLAMKQNDIERLLAQLLRTDSPERPPAGTEESRKRPRESTP